MTPPVLMAEAVGRSYPTGGCVALSDVTLSIDRGDYLAITGPSGSGKSTLLHLLSGLDRPTQGRVLFDGVEPRSAAEWTAIRAREIGFVFQAFHLLPTLTARQNIEVPMLGVVRGERERRARVEELMERVGLQDRSDHRPTELSGGEKQRVAIARSLANRPAVILADEPTGNLDSESAMQILDLLEELRRLDGTALVVVTHDPGVAERATKRLALRDGTVSSVTSREEERRGDEVGGSGSSRETGRRPPASGAGRGTRAR